MAKLVPIEDYQPAKQGPRLVPIEQFYGSDEERAYSKGGEVLRGIPGGVLNVAVGLDQFGRKILPDSVNRVMDRIDTRLFGKTSSKATDETRKKFISDDPYNKLGQFTGELGATIYPFSKIPIAASLFGKMGQGAGLSGTYAATAVPMEGADEMTRTEYAKNKTLPVLAAAATGAVLPAVFAGGKKGYETVRDLNRLRTPKGQEKIVDDYIRYAAGDYKKEIADELATTHTKTPGLQPTAGQELAYLPEAAPLIAHEKQVASSVPGSQRYGRRLLEQNRAMKGAIDQVGKTPEALAAAAENRAVNAEKYQAIEDVPILLRGNGETGFDKFLNRPSVQEALKKVFRGAAERGNRIPELTDDAMTVGNLQRLKMALDDAVSDPKTFGLGKTEVAEIDATRKLFVNWLSSKSEPWRVARETYAKDSDPINRMQIGQKMSEQFDNYAAEGENATSASMNAFARNFRKLDAGDYPGFFKKNGMPRFANAQEAFKNAPDEYALLSGVADDVSRRNAFKNPLQRANLSGAEHMQGAETPSLPPFIDWKAAVANKLFRSAGKDVKDELNTIAVDKYLDPKKIQAILSKLPKDSPLAKLIRDNQMAIYASLANSAGGQVPLAMGVNWAMTPDDQPQPIIIQQ